MTGEGLYGEHAGDRMAAANLLQMNVEQALAMDSTVEIAISDRPFNTGGQSMSSRWAPNNPDATLMPGFVETLGEEDTRLDRMEMGLGVWNENTRRYYSVKVLRENGNYIIDELDGQKMLVFLDPLTSTPSAVFWDTRNVTIEGRNISLDDGYSIRYGQIYDGQGELVSIQQPQQMFTRWYGFSLSFPNPEIFE